MTGASIHGDPAWSGRLSVRGPHIDQFVLVCDRNSVNPVEYLTDVPMEPGSMRRKGHTLRRRHLPAHIAEPSGLVSLGGFASLADMEKQHIRAALKQARGNQSEAAALLGIHRNTLANKMRRYGIEG
jgi:DNA-binding NtrC family response regulator